MSLHAISPGPPLDALIERIWDWDMPLAAHHLERILASPKPALIINLAEDHTRVYANDNDDSCRIGPASFFSGPYTHSFVIDTLEQQQVMGVVFRAGAALAITREPLHRLSNGDTALESLAGPSAERLRQRLLNTPQPLRRLAALEQWLRARVAMTHPDPLVTHALNILTRSPQTARIGDIAADCGVSSRRLGDLFREHVGISPKRQARLLRFRAVVDAVHQRRHVNWAAVAADCGFHDQPHLTHEFRAFSGMTPGRYIARMGPHPNHVPLA